MLVNVSIDKLAYLILMCEYYITDDVLMYQISQYFRDRRGRNRMVVGFTTTYAISAYHHKRCEFEPRWGEVYSIQYYVIKFFSDLRQVGGFLLVFRFLLQ
jgi:hypothetical protein